MMNLIFLFGLHHLADTAFQPNWMIELKKTRLFTHYEHAFVWSFVVSIGLALLGLFAPWKFLFLLIVHGLIDITKYQILPKKMGRNPYWLIYPDQALHYLQILTVYYL